MFLIKTISCPQERWWYKTGHQPEETQRIHRSSACCLVGLLVQIVGCLIDLACGTMELVTRYNHVCHFESVYCMSSCISNKCNGVKISISDMFEAVFNIAASSYFLIGSLFCFKVYLEPNF